MVVNYNTRRLIAQLIYSLYRILQPPMFRLVVVDNGSTDGSAELLSAAAAAGLCHLVANPTNRHHGPGLNQGVSYLAEATRRDGAVPISYVWLLDYAASRRAASGAGSTLPRWSFTATSFGM